MPMIKYPFNGQLNSNEIFSSIFNMIISQDVAYPELTNNFDLLSMFKVDGTLFGDTKLFYAQDILKSRPWLGDAEAANLLNVNRPADPKCQAITLDRFRQIDTSLDNYLSKRAWSTEGAFSTFTNIVEAMVSETKKVYENTMFNVYACTTEGDATKSTIKIDLDSITETGEEKNRLEAQKIAQALADLEIEMKDYSRDFNDYHFMRAYSPSELMFIVNSKWANKITNLDLPTIYHKEGLNKLTDHITPARYFGTKVEDVTDDSDHFAETSVGSGIYTVKSGVTVVRACEEIDVEKADYTGRLHLMPGDLIPATYVVKGETSEGYEYDYSGNVYIERDDIICKIVTKDTYKMMSAFQTATEFFNPRALVSNHYLTWGYSQPDRLKDKPLVTVFAD